MESSGDLPSYKDVRDVLEKLIKEDGEMDDEDDVNLVYWIMNSLVSSVVGGRWVPIGRLTDKEREKRSFCQNVSPSDIGFCLYLLEYYGKSAMHFKSEERKEKKNRWKKVDQNSSLEFFTKHAKEMSAIFGKMTGEDKINLDNKIIKMLKETRDKDKQEETEDDEIDIDEEEKQTTIYSGCSFMMGV